MGIMKWAEGHMFICVCFLDFMWAIVYWSVCIFESIYEFPKKKSHPKHFYEWKCFC